MTLALEDTLDDLDLTEEQKELLGIRIVQLYCTLDTAMDKLTDAE